MIFGGIGEAGYYSFEVMNVELGTQIKMIESIYKFFKIKISQGDV